MGDHNKVEVAEQPGTTHADVDALDSSGGDTKSKRAAAKEPKKKKSSVLKEKRPLPTQGAYTEVAAGADVNVEARGTSKSALQDDFKPSQSNELKTKAAKAE